MKLAFHALVVTLAAVAATGCEEPAADTLGPLAPRSACRVVVIAIDYRSSSVSLVTPTGQVCAPDIVDSGSRAPALLTALSGDVVVPSGPTPDGQIYLIDRYPNAVLTRLDAASGAVLGQLALSPGFAGNPQDLVTIDAHTAMVSRLQANPEPPDPTSPTTDPDAGGSDLLFVDTVTDQRLGTLSLASHATPGFDAQPTQLARLGERDHHVWVGLSHLDRQFATAGPGRVLGVDPLARTVTNTVDLPGMKNCGHLVATASDAAVQGIWVACSGLFKEGGAAQLAASGLAFIAADGTVLWTGHAADLGGQPIGFGLGALSSAHSSDRVLAVGVGSTATDAPDHLLLVDRRTGTATPILATAPFTLGQIAVTPSAILVADADPRTPLLQRLTLGADGVPREDGTIQVSRTGLPPRAIAMYLTP